MVCSAGSNDGVESALLVAVEVAASTKIRTCVIQQVRGVHFPSLPELLSDDLRHRQPPLRTGHPLLGSQWIDNSSRSIFA